ncbi:HAD hydrolase-like protein [Phenylobacterium soli]|uniref:HAD family hydrolase n=1 Tax=Phenylobacterium soli TaxID=2170551 RepID=A0A328AIA0_9CAUL|nr:HAD hydrolase-like protein [Phenylobacterium soli]RAK54261.1 HAD family hydrolase [Phenylobacterium soli]
MPVRARKTLLLDLDGTLVDPAPGILGSMRHALARLGADAPEDADLSWMIGPPIRASVARLLGETVDPEEAVALYRERYAEWGLRQATPYPGMLQTLAARKADGTRLILCTSKAAVFARQVVDHFGFAPLLSAVYGAELDGRRENKAELIAHILEAEGLDPAQACMVGDREHDVIGAARHGIPTVGVLWGFGDRAELEAAGAAVVIARPEELALPA